MSEFKKELADVFEKYSLDTTLNIPDVVLAETVVNLLATLSKCQKDCEEYVVTENVLPVVVDVNGDQLT